MSSDLKEVSPVRNRENRGIEEHKNNSYKKLDSDDF